jgi:transcriptional regulator with XRE-family HTH domain
MSPEPKIDQRMVERIKQLRAEGKTQEEIAVEVGLAQGSVSLILKAHGLGGYLVKVKRRKWS